MSTQDKVALAYELLLNQKMIDSLREGWGFAPDYYDLIGFYGYGRTFCSKQERIDSVVDYVITLPDDQQKVINILLECYRHTDFTDLRLLKIFDLPIFKNAGYTRKTAIKPFGDKDGYTAVVDELEHKMF